MFKEKLQFPWSVSLDMLGGNNFQVSNGLVL